MAIPIVLFYFVRSRKTLVFRPVLLLFGLFITACGWTHFLGYYTFENPIYRLDGLVKAITAAVSWVTVVALVPLVPRALAMRSPEELEAEIAARKAAEADLRNAQEGLERRVEERTAEIQSLNEDLRRAMAETHHRVKNNLQVVSALLEMQVDESQAAVPRAVVHESLQQIKTIAVVHDLLSRDHESGTVDVTQVLANLVPLLAEGLHKGSALIPITFKGNFEPVRLPTKAATGLALVVNELLSNAVKHGHITNGRESSDDAITIYLERQPAGGLLLVVEDHGPGFGPDFDPEIDSNLGLELVKSIVANDLHGTVHFTSTSDASAGRPSSTPFRGNGARIEVSFRDDSRLE